MRVFIATIAVGLAITTTVFACINDSELPAHEREFRSSYNHKTSLEIPKQSWSSEVVPLALYGAGSVFLAAAGIIVFRKTSGK
jgi:hypothetical protein